MSQELVTVENDAGQVTKVEEDIAGLIEVARRYPRDVAQCLESAKTMATLDAKTAESMFYVLPPRKGSTEVIEGPSARCAELLVSNWGNIRAGAEVVGIRDGRVIARAVCYDLQQNISFTAEVATRCTYKNGDLYNDDMMTNAENAAKSKAYRNAVFKVIPLSVAQLIVDHSKEAMQRKAGTLAERQRNCIERFRALGVSPGDVLELVGVGAMADLATSHIEQLIGTYNAVKNGEQTIDDVFGDRDQLSEDAINTHARNCEDIVQCDKLQKELTEQFPSQAQEIYDAMEARRDAIKEG